MPLACTAHAGFEEMDAVLAGGDIDCEFSGCTLVVAFMHGSRLSVAWVGDTRAVLGRRDPAGALCAHALTADHRPAVPEEKARILSHNGRVAR
jgi:serine/threonine protein phosphatase PrpC